MIEHTKAYGVYHWDTFDNNTFLVGEADTVLEAEAIVKREYGNAVLVTSFLGHETNKADRVEIVDKQGNIVRQYGV